MKLLSILFASLVLTVAASAVEYVTLTSVTLTKSIAPTAVVEIVGYSGIKSDKTHKVSLVFADGATQDLILSGVYRPTTQSDSAVSTLNPKGNKFTGLTSVSREADAGNFSLTLKITPISELNSIASGVVTLPADVGAGYTVTLQESSDLSIWNTAFPGSFTGEAIPKFFRVLLKKKAAE
jgi:hypothetical protein